MLLNSLSAFEHAVAMCGAMETTVPDHAAMASMVGSEIATSNFYGGGISTINEDFDVNDRLYHTSPIIFDHNDTYTVEDSFLSSDARSSELSTIEESSKEPMAAQNAESYFRPLAVPKITGPFGQQLLHKMAAERDMRAEIVANANAALRANAQSVTPRPGASAEGYQDSDATSASSGAAVAAAAADAATPQGGATGSGSAVVTGQSAGDESTDAGREGDDGAGYAESSPSFDAASSYNELSDAPAVVSALTQQLELVQLQETRVSGTSYSGYGGGGGGGGGGGMVDVGPSGGITLTIYLPDGSAMNVNTGKNCDFKEVIVQTLNAHKIQGRRPALNYSNPAGYEIRLHEGDGEPDRDFPALEPSKRVVDFNFDEYCLCAVKGSDADSGSGGGNGKSDGVRHIRPSSFTGASFTMIEAMAVTGGNGGGGGGGSFPDNSSSNQTSARGADGYGGGRGPVRFDVNDGSRERSRQTRYDGFEFSGTPTSRNSTPSMTGPPLPSDYSDSIDHALERLMDNVVYIIFPTGERLDVFYEQDMKMIELIPLISGTQRLRLYTDEYIFKVSDADQRRLQLMSPVVDMDTRVEDVGTFTFEIHKKVYADEGKRAHKGSNSAVHHAKRKSTADHDRILFTDASANAYQEWNVVKKNKFGRRQDRVFGVDGKKVYNAKRGQSVRSGAAGSSGVQRAERPIKSIVNIDVLHNDPKTFRITWMDDRDLYNIEYTCESTRDCYEIVQKIKYILRRNLPTK